MSVDYSISKEGIQGLYQYECVGFSVWTFMLQRYDDFIMGMDVLIM